MTIKRDAPFTRYEFLKELEKNGIQTRVMFSGNITRHPVYKSIKYKIASKLTNSDTIMSSGFLLGCHHGMSVKDAQLVINSSDKFLSQYK